MGEAMKKVFIFDFDGTLVDSAKYIAQLVYDFFESRNMEYPPDVVKKIMPMGWHGFARYVRSMGVTESVEEIVEGIHRSFYRIYTEEIKLKPHSLDYIKKLKAEGVSCNILTGSPHRLVEPCITANGADGIFDNLWSVDDFMLMKTDPKLYEEVAKRLGVPFSEICFFDDNFEVLKTCKALGFETVGVYDATSEEYKEDIKAVVDKYIVSFDELL